MTAIFCVAVGRRIGEGTAKFYLDVAEGNLRDAIALYGKIKSTHSQLLQSRVHSVQYIGFCAGMHVT